MFNEMKQFLSFVIKEAKHILRDKRTMLILFGMPVVLMFIFGFAITTDVKNVRTVVVTSQMDHLTQQAVERLAVSEYFIITKTVSTPSEAEYLIRSQKADMAVVFANDFASKKNGIQFIVDGSDPNMSQQWVAYAQQTIAAASPSVPSVAGKQGSGASQSALHTSLLYNPQMKSAYNFVPAIMGMLLMLVCAMMTSISIVREKERGTMEVLSSADGDYRQSRALSGACLLYPDCHLVDGALRDGCSPGWFFVLDYRRLYLIYIVGTLTGFAYLEYCRDTAGGLAHVGYDAPDSCRDALRYAVSCGVDASCVAMVGSRDSSSLLHSGHAQTDDYGCRHCRCDAGGGHPVCDDSILPHHRT